ncbi:MAG TPA: DEAD/DEAH box helicase [Paludibaculum sp.]|jgi:ATP-dependent RNA helicase RhlE
MNNFSELSLSSVLKDNLSRHGFVTPTPVQAQAIPPALLGRDIVATAQTGTGKTLAFVLPMLEKLSAAPLAKGVHAVVLSPTRELAIQIHEAFMLLASGTGIRAAVVVGGMNEQKQLLEIRKGAQVLICTPGRLCDFLERRLVRLTGVSMLVLDEADRMLDMGFLPAITEILETMPESKQTLFFSATIEQSVAHLINNYLTNPVRIAVGSTTKPAEHVDLHVYEVEQDRKLGLLRQMLTDEQGSFLVFARTKHGADRLSKKLSAHGVKATSIHGDRTQSQRNQALKGFQQGYYRVLVATDVAARGIHVDGIAHVVNFDLPQVPEDFIHRVGRTGRAGARGVASTFHTRGERGEIRRIERTIRMQLETRQVPRDLPQEDKSLMATTVVAMPVPSSRPQAQHHRSQGHPAAFTTRRRAMRVAR